jgi:regulatory protein PHO2
MEIPYDTIIDAEFTNAAPGTGLASFLLSQPPLFFLEHVSSPTPDRPTVRQWRPCPDWTEGHQASQVLRHDLIGSAVQLSHFLRNLRAGSRSDIPLRPADSYRTVASPPMQMPRPSPPMELPLPPLANLAGANLRVHYQNDGLDLPPSLGRRDLDRKRLSYSGSGMTNDSPDAFTNTTTQTPPQSAPANGRYAQHPSYAAVSQQGTPASSSFGSPMFNDYVPEAHHVGHSGQHPTRDEYSGIRISSGLIPRPYPVMDRTFYDEATHKLAPPYQPRRSSYDQNESSPPLLTTPYHPPAHILENLSQGHSDAGSLPITSGLPSIPVYGDHY